MRTELPVLILTLCLVTAGAAPAMAATGGQAPADEQTAAVGGTPADVATAAAAANAPIDVRLGSAAPGAVDEGASTVVSVTYDVNNVSGDGSTDRFEVAFPAAVNVTAIENVEFANQSNPPDTYSQNEQLQTGERDRVVMTSQRDANDQPYDVSVTLNVSVTGAPVASDVTGEVNASVVDSDGDTDDETVATLTVRDAADDDRTVTLLTYNDVQTAAAGNENRTFSRMAELIHQRRQTVSNPVFVAGAGDQVGPHALSTLESWKPPVHVLNATSPDADVIGNHEFDYADAEDNFSSVEAFSNASTFPWLLSNVVYRQAPNTGLPGTKNYTIVERGNVTVGYIGLIDEGAANGKTSNIVGDAGYEVLDPARTGEAKARMLKEEQGVDVVVALAHTGVPDAKEIANGSPSIDVIATGDDEIRYPPAETNGVLITEAKARALYVSEVNVTVDSSTGEVVSKEGRLIPVTTDVPRNETAERIVEGFRSEYGFNQVVADSEVVLDARFSTNYRESSTFGNLATNGFRYVTDADVAITNPGGIRNDRTYGPGNITRGDIKASLPFPNTVVVKRVNGTQLKELLAYSISTTDAFFGAQAGQQVSGVTYEWVPHASVPVEQRVQDVYVNGKPLDESATYTVATNSFQAGDNYVLSRSPTVRNYANVTYAEAAVRYAQDLGTIEDEDVSPELLGRTRRVDRTDGEATVSTGAQNVTVTFEAPDNATSVTDDVVLRNRSVGRARALDASLSNGNVTATFDATAFNATTRGATDLDVYAEYNDSEYSPQLDNFEYAVVNAELNVSEVSTNPFRSGVPGAGASAPPSDTDGDGKFEDVDGDGSFDFVDVVSFLFVSFEAVNGDDAQQAALDFDGDGTVDFLDVVTLLFELG
jgi:2',3'-cyclic-nucleotide 2'-phosphodiesterase (5'-nucleotidase family)